MDEKFFKPFHIHTKRVVMSKKGNGINYRLACECGKRSLNVVRKAVMITALPRTQNGQDSRWWCWLLRHIGIAAQRWQGIYHVHTYVCEATEKHRPSWTNGSRYEYPIIIFYTEVNAESRRIKIKNSFLHTFKWRLPITSSRHTNNKTSSCWGIKIKSVAKKLKKKNL